MVETTKGKVKNVRKDRKGLELDNGSWYSIRTGEVPSTINRGDTVSITFSVNGRYNNIETISKTDSAPSSSPYSGYSPKADNPAALMMNGVFAMTCKFIELQSKLAEIKKETPDADIGAFMNMAVGLTADAYLAMKRTIEADGAVPAQGGEELHPAGA